MADESREQERRLRELQEREAELARREAELDQREKALRAQSADDGIYSKINISRKALDRAILVLIILLVAVLAVAFWRAA